MLNLTCEFGEFDILFEAAGIQDFSGLEERSLSVLVGRTETQLVEQQRRNKEIGMSRADQK
jgi:hypothetical protein